MTKLVNLDDLVAIPRSVKFKSKKYEIQDLALRDYVAAQQALKTSDEARLKNDLDGVIAAAKEIIKLAAPTFPLELVDKMNFRQIMVFLNLIFDQYPEVDAPKDASTGETPGQEASGNA